MQSPGTLDRHAIAELVVHARSPFGVFGGPVDAACRIEVIGALVLRQAVCDKFLHHRPGARPGEQMARERMHTARSTIIAGVEPRRAERRRRYSHHIVHDRRRARDAGDLAHRRAVEIADPHADR